jgi:predicted Rossmann-fold nucleotide-binding protein
MKIKICCFGSSKKHTVIDQSYFDQTISLLKEIQSTQIPITFVYGGGERGIMGCTRSACKNENGIISSNVNKFVKVGEATDDFLYDNIAQRQNKLVELGDVFIGLPGGIGTLYEIFQVSYSNHLNFNKTKPIYISNQNGIYSSLEMILKELYNTGHTKLDCHVFDNSNFIYDVIQSKVIHEVALPWYETCYENRDSYIATIPDIKTYYELSKYITFNDIGETFIPICIDNTQHKFDNFINLLCKMMSEKFISKSFQQLNLTIIQ